jgi:hypothetical protein
MKTMNVKTMSAAALCILAVSAAGCSSWDAYGVKSTHGDAVRSNKEAQLYNPAAATYPSPDPVEGTDGQRMEAVLEAHRGRTGSAESVGQPIVINVGD